jgi:hypothetical protein
VSAGWVGVAGAVGPSAAGVSLDDGAGQDHAGAGDGGELGGDLAGFVPLVRVEVHAATFASGVHHIGDVLLYIYSVNPARVSEVIAVWRPWAFPEPAAGFAREVVARVGPVSVMRARSLLWATAALARFGLTVGLEPAPAVLLHPSVIERFVVVGMAASPEARRRTVRTNLRFVARRVVPQLLSPAPVGLSRSRAKTPYSPAEIDAYLGLAAAQPTEARRHRLAALVGLGAGAGLAGGDLRHVRGRHVSRRHGGVVVVVERQTTREVPLLARYHRPVLAAATFAGEGYICGGSSPERHNVTWNLVDSLSGGADLPRLELARLRATWLGPRRARPRPGPSGGRARPMRRVR